MLDAHIDGVPQIGLSLLEIGLDWVKGPLCGHFTGLQKQQTNCPTPFSFFLRSLPFSRKEKGKPQIALELFSKMA